MKRKSNQGRTGFRLIAAAVAVMALGACESFQETLGLTKQVPDEFNVVTKAPLNLPPDYNLRPPTPGARRPQEKTPSEEARKTLWKEPTDTAQSTPSGSALLQGTTTNASPAPESTGETALLKLAGADNPDSNIRRVVAQDNSRIEEKDKSFVDRLIFWQTQPPFGTVINPAEEAKRLRENAALGKPATEGVTPQIRRRKRSMFEGVF
jgi:hypothetical protein